MAALIKDGVRFIDDQPRQGAHGSRIAFIHPTSMGGQLIDRPIVERARRTIDLARALEIAA